jgi:hypothetical protein
MNFGSVSFKVIDIKSLTQLLVKVYFKLYLNYIYVYISTWHDSNVKGNGIHDMYVNEFYFELYLCVYNYMTRQ